MLIFTFLFLILLAISTIVTPAVIKQVDLQIDEIDHLWPIAQFVHLGPQGTTLNESLHGELIKQRPTNLSRASYDTLNMQLGILIYQHNSRYSNIV